MSVADQVPVQSGFGAKSTGREVLAGLDLSGKTALVTGGYSGLGLETVRALAEAGARVIIPVRSPDKAAGALAGLEGDIRTAPMDLADLSSIAGFADEMRDSLTRLDWLINNAGIMACPEARVGPGWESQFGVNHMGHFALTAALMPLLQATEGARVVSLSSTGHKIAGIRWEDLHFRSGAYDKWQAYGQAKTANALFANALSRRLTASGGLAFSVHPGGIFTPLQRHLPKEEMVALGWLGEDGEPSELARKGFKTPEQGCATTLWAATSACLVGRPGVYCENCDIAAPTDPDGPMARYAGVDAHACDDAAAERLWTISEALLADARELRCPDAVPARLPDGPRLTRAGTGYGAAKRVHPVADTGRMSGRLDFRGSWMRFGISVVAGLCLAGSAFAQDQGFGVFEGEVTEAAPSAEYPLTLEAGSIVTLSTDSIENFDTILTLIGPDGKPLAENDDREPGNLQSLIVHRVEMSGTYTVAVTGYGGGTGVFELTVQDGIETGLSDEAQVLASDIVTLDAGNTSLTRTVDLAAEDIFVATTFALTDTLDTTLTLTGPSGEILLQNDDRGDGSLNSQLVFQAEAAGRYTVEVGSYSGSDAGDLVLSLAIDPNAEVPFDFAGVEGEDLGEFSGNINDANPEQAYPVELEAGQTIYAVLDTVDGDLDPVVRLLDPDGHAVAVNDDRGDGSLNSALAYTAAQAGTYTVNVERYRAATSAGGYSLILRLVDAETVSVLQALRDNIIRLSGEVLSYDTEDFRVFYTLEGRDASTEEYALSVGVTLQEVYDAQINRIGWAEPIRDDEGLFRAYISDAGGSMGVTYPVQIVFDNPNTLDKRENMAARTVFLVENDFRGLGKEAPVHALMRATATHEFNHVVQFGYDAEEALDWLYEATASWTETTTVGADQDATDYVSTDYEMPQICWTTAESGFDYAQWTLLQSIADQFGEGIVVEFWENTVDMDGFETMAVSLERAGTTLPDTIRRWRAQNFARDYQLAPLFDATVAVAHTMDAPGRYSAKGGLEETGANYILLDGMSGQYQVSLDGAEGLEVVLLGQAGDAVQVIPLGTSGAIDTTGFEQAALMVFNRTLPAQPGQCSSTGYALDVSEGSGRMPAPAYSFSAAHFEVPGQ